MNKVPSEWQLRPVFQPIVDLNQGTTYGYEGLIRAIDPVAVEIITPYAMFDDAVRGGFVHDLDRRCREVIIEAFSSRFSHDEKARLFVNVHPSVIGDTEVPTHLYKTAVRCNMLPENIIIEVDECRVADERVLESFTANCRHYGFGLALDDFGVFPCNPDRISLLQPEILKIDISLVREMLNNEHAGLAVRTLVQLAARTGSVVIAEGVETEEEAVRVLEAGCSNIQGFYFSKPVDIIALPQPSVKEKTRVVMRYLKMKKRTIGIPAIRALSKLPAGDTPDTNYVIIPS